MAAATRPPGVPEELSESSDGETIPNLSTRNGNLNPSGSTITPNEGLEETERSRGHDHEPDPHYPDEVALRRAILDRCRSLEYVSFRDILDQEGAWFDFEVQSRVTLARMRNAMRSARMQNYPELPRSLRNLTRVLNDDQFRVITQTEDGTDNLYGGSVTATDGSHHIMFVSQRMLNYLKISRILHGDGTRKVIPLGANANFLAQQVHLKLVYVILTTWDYHVIPLAWVLMESQTNAAYDAVCQLLRRLVGDDIIVERIITDFEPAQRNGWINNFDTTVQGCLWHLVRAYVDEAKELNLGWWMRNVDEYRRLIRLAGTLPLLPRRLMRRGLILLTQEAMREGPAFYGRVRPFLRYLNQRWVSDPIRAQWMCVYRSVHRTNNAAESHNKTMKLLMGTHPNIYSFINVLIRLERCAFRDCQALENGRRVSNGRKACAVTNDNRLRRLQNDLNNPRGHQDEAIWNYMRRASAVMRNVFNEAVYH
ncbi:GTPase Der [Frankliniella fusca]|uniref:GTPase Der n=1 Tax=Frankliniella fusca TaxID=407009 RepID=A0AAE1HT31_9NEOP|nr:GTPase Der [Frankliniella fusca]